MDSRGRGTKGCRGASLADSWGKESFLHAWMRSRGIIVISGVTSPPSVSMGHRLAYSAGLCGQKSYYSTDGLFQNCKANCLVNNVLQGNFIRVKYLLDNFLLRLSDDYVRIVPLIKTVKANLDFLVSKV